MNSDSRFYRNELPHVDSFVMARIIKVEDLGATCELLEYNNMRAFMPSSHFSRRWIKSIRQVAKAGSEEILQVYSVNEGNGTVDLSKKMLTDDDIDKGNTFFQKSKRFHSLMRRVADVCHKDVQELYESFGWNLYDQDNVHPVEILETALNDVCVLDRFNIPDEFKPTFIETVNKRIQLDPEKYETEISVTCYDANGVDTLKKIFEEFETLTGINPTIKSPPSYNLTTVSTNVKEAVSRLTKLNEQLQQICQQHGAVFAIVSEPAKCEKQ